MRPNLEILSALLKEKFGYPSFRPLQLRVFERLMAGESGLVVLSTGGGKSLFYQLWSAAQSDLVVVLSPLIALMQDQVDQANAAGLEALCLNAAMTKQEREQRLEWLKTGRGRLLFVTPERFRKAEFREVLQGRKISLFVVDEAHCISQWGHDFRPDYSRAGEIREFLGNPQTLALTATATPRVQEEICQQLGLSCRGGLGFVEIAPIRRPELSCNVHSVHGMDEKIRSIVGIKYAVSGSVLVYASLISTLYQIRTELQRLGLEPLLYHGQMSGSDRKRVLRQFQEDPQAFLIGTPAFGLGINKPDLRAVIHLEIPTALESYFQEIGRAGRDGRDAFAHLLFDPDDISIQMDFIKWGNPDGGFVQTVARLIRDYQIRVRQEGADFLRDQMNFYNSRDFRVETTLNLLERWGCLERSSEGGRLGFLFVRMPESEELDGLIQRARLGQQNRKLLDMVSFAQSVEGCRMVMIERYFGELGGEPCGKCDLCVSSRASSVSI